MSLLFVSFICTHSCFFLFLFLFGTTKIKRPKDNASINFERRILLETDRHHQEDYYDDDYDGDTDTYTHIEHSINSFFSIICPLSLLFYIVWWYKRQIYLKRTGRHKKN